ncbi:MAG: alkaline phosphatase family protein [Candidatus Aenigmatarchaeota archaeon]
MFCKKTFFIILILLLTICLIVILSGRVRSENRVFLICMDGADWKVIDPLIEEGALPNFKKLKEEGSYGYLKSPTSFSPIEWTSIATGKKPTNHGIDSYQADGSFVTSSDVKSKWVWELAEESGDTVGIYNWLLAWPAEKVNGFMISLTSINPSAEMSVYPENLSDGVEMKNRFYNFTFQTDEVLYLFNRFVPDIFLVGDTGNRVIQGMLWKYWEPEKFNLTNQTEINMGRKILVEHYKKIDRLLNEFMSVNNSVTFLVSDHGFHEKIPSVYTIDFGFEYFFGANVCKLNVHTLSDVEYLDLCSEGKIPDKDVEFLLNITYAKSKERVFTSIKIINESRIRLSYNGTLLKYNSEPNFPSTFYLGLVVRNSTVKLVFHEHSGNHDRLPIDGVIIARGDMIKNSYQIQDAVTYDITPTILYLMGIPVPEDMDGMVLVDMIKDDYMSSNPIRYSDLSSQKQRAEVDINTSEIEEKLKELGYIT